MLTLFVLSFLAATILPIGCEAYFLYIISKNESVISYLTVATIGNSLGSAFTFKVAQLIGIQRSLSFFKISNKSFERSKNIARRYGWFTSFFCFLPIIGDAIAIALGVLEISFKRFMIAMTLGKFMRFYFLAYLSEVALSLWPK